MPGLPAEEVTVWKSPVSALQSSSALVVDARGFHLKDWMRPWRTMWMVRAEVSVWQVLEGRAGWDLRNEPPVEIHPGEAVLIPPLSPYRRYSLDGKPYLIKGGAIRLNLRGFRDFARNLILPRKLEPEQANKFTSVTDKLAAQPENLDLAAVAERLELVTKFLRVLAELSISTRSNAEPLSTWTTLQPAIDLAHHFEGQAPGRAEMAAACHVSESTLYKLFQKTMGCAPMQFLNHVRVLRAAEIICHSSIPLKTIAPTLGFADEYHLSRLFQQHMGLRPSSYRKQARATEIQSH